MRTTLDKAFVYKLINPINNDVFYIGKTTDPEGRLKAHLICARNTDFQSDLYIYIRNLLNQNKMPIMEIIGRQNIKIYETTETYYIKYYATIYKLCNKPRAKNHKNDNKVSDQ